MIVYPPILTSVLQWKSLFLGFPVFFRKIKEMIYFLNVCKGKNLVSEIVANITKTKKDTLCQL